MPLTLGLVEKPRPGNDASVLKGIASAQKAAPRNDDLLDVIARNGVRRRRTERRSNPLEWHRTLFTASRTFSTVPKVSGTHNLEWRLAHGKPCGTRLSRTGLLTSAWYRGCQEPCATISPSHSHPSQRSAPDLPTTADRLPSPRIHGSEDPWHRPRRLSILRCGALRRAQHECHDGIALGDGQFGALGVAVEVVGPEILTL